MISPVQNNYSPNFTSVMPVRVKIDGKESYSEYFIRPACKKLSAILLGPTAKNDEKKLNIIKTFAQHDPDYNFNLGLSGHPNTKSGKKAKPSDYFKYFTQKFEHFFMTGKQAENLKKYGKQVGNEKYTGKILDVDNSFDVEVARDNYWGSLRNYIDKKIYRLKDESKNPVSLVIDMTSNKKYGQSGFKMDVDKVSFELA